MPYKVFSFGNIYEVYHYEREPYIPTKKNDVDNEALYLLTGDEKYLARDKIPEWVKELNKRKCKETNGRNKRAAFRRLVLANFSSANFITLTFRDTDKFDITNVEDCNKEFDKFMKRLRRRYGNDFKFINVIEFQKRGAVHFHMLADLGITFANQEEERALERAFADEIWQNGFVDIKNVEHVDNLGAYLSKYMAKDFDTRLNGKKSYRCSMNCVRPTILKDDEEAENILREYKKNETYRSEYHSEYLGKITYIEINKHREKN